MSSYNIQLADGVIELIEIPNGQDPQTWFINLVMAGNFVAAYIAEAVPILNNRGLSEEDNYVIVPFQSHPAIAHIEF